MKPDKIGIWEWFAKNGEKRLVRVWDVHENNPELGPYLRVCWWGGYYNVNDEHDLEAPQYDHLTKAEWPDRWGNFVGAVGCVPEWQLYDQPTPEESSAIEESFS